MQRFLVTIEAENLHETEEMELLGPPDAGDPIETKLGSCTVVEVTQEPPGKQYAGRIRCSYP